MLKIRQSIISFPAKKTLFHKTYNLTLEELLRTMIKKINNKEELNLQLEHSNLKNNAVISL